MKKAFTIALVVVGVAFAIGGVYTTIRGFDAKGQVRDQLVAQNITTPDDAEIPGVLVQDAATARAMADIIGVHAAEATGGETYAEMGRFLAADGGDTSDETLALLDEAGNPVPNPLRNVAFQASSLRTSLYTSELAFGVSDLVIGLGLMITVLGLVILGLGIYLGTLKAAGMASSVEEAPEALEMVAA